MKRCFFFSLCHVIILQGDKMKLCKNCAKEVKDNAIICPYCGSSFQDKKEGILEENIQEKEIHQNQENKKQPYMDNGIIRGPFYKWISIPLCILLGWLGVHKFYERKYIIGVFYAITFGFWGIGIVFDLIKLVKQPKYYYISRIPFMI